MKVGKMTKSFEIDHLKLNSGGRGILGFGLNYMILRTQILISGVKEHYTQRSLLLLTIIAE